MPAPAYVDGKPPVISLLDYDEAEWAEGTCVDSRPGYYVVVNMERPEEVVARFNLDANTTLDTIFKSAKKTYKEQAK
ncbi:hypothetical protein BABINDRAFT_38148 [Babjeviella inositovora NRRL Y-12698]|uniref:Uncharacterized protein n=1 Tax=Babjeviella inositovora NRRL Y-12698 TaxID=984486 RepID=A0A1E3QN01_9ASCO|nr:uncharacterized protein BABINDRAFT_38148 [Babjeviella inositovora NRRL Y-12698]ODQ79086.1 hypothetical protein BABINDRAFT_38148 [Babjeviella inositovora NRRL Y-12698]